ncbi:MAG TPA: ribonuclease J [Oscillospiraceae bacterium]|nr:ribonuclease J [Oscillospiraceae bacterium]HRW56962.1 ribonuclease J [Oscillospiraceae bacterium]
MEWKNNSPAGWNQKKRGRPSKNTKLPPLKIIPLGGLGEIGKNLTVFEYNDDIVIVDCGLAFPGDEMLGVDLVIPDFTYLEENRDRIRGLVVTHGHEDHIGGIPYLLQKLNIPIYATRFTIALIEGKLAEKGLLNKAVLNVVKPRETVTLGCMDVEFIHVNHSIPDSCALALHTPAGIVIETGDFKVDYTPTNDEIIDLARFGELGSKGVLALLSDSTNAERPGYTPSERTVGESFDLLFKNAGDRRILVATFSSNVHRVQLVIDSAVRFGRKVAVVGRSMEQVTTKALEMGYLDAPEGTVVSLDTVCRLPENEAVIVTTGSQGETMAALTRMAMGDHRKINITSRDLVIISAYPIPGNEKDVGRVVNELMRLGAEVVYERYSQIHVSGHACQDEEKLMLALTKPHFFIPVHGEYKHLKKHAELALSMGMLPENVVIPEIGRVIEVNEAGITALSSVSAGAILVDGLGVGDVGSVVLRDRKRLGEDGLIIVTITLDHDNGDILAGPDIVSRGFVYVREAEDMLEATKQIVRKTVEASISDNKRDWQNLKTKIKDAVGSYLFGLTKRSPMVLPIIEEISQASV